MIPRAPLTLAAILVLACGADREADTPRDTLPPRVSTERPRIVFLGTSLTAGLGVSPDSAFPALIQRRLDSLGAAFDVVNAGVSGETAAGGLRRAGWMLGQPFEILVVELGANDGLRGTEPDSIRGTLGELITLARSRAPEAAIVLAGMEAPPNLGTRYTASFRAIFPALAAQHEVTLIPFLLEGVAGIDSLNQSDRMHPNEAGHRVLAETVWRTLAPLVGATDRSPAS